MALEKLPFLPALYIGYYITMTAPNPPPSRKEISKNPSVDRVSDGTILPLFKVAKALLLPVILCETTVIISSHFATSMFAETALNDLVRIPSSTPAITPIFLIGFLLCLCGAYVRLSSYRALGRLFTFEVSIRDQHKLITTYPYSIVRHPAYISLIAPLTGIILCLFGPGSWVFECGWFELLTVKIFAVIIAAVHAYIIYVVLARMDNEDKMMKREFGGQWDEWAKDVPYKLVPGIF